MVIKRKESNRLVLVDGHAIVHRAYHAIPVLTSRSGRQTNAVYGFVSMLLRVVDDLKPAWLAVCFDLPVPTFRHEAYIAYQAHRPQVDQELKDQIELVKEVLETSGIPIYAAPGYEADDVIGTIARQFVEATPASHVSRLTSAPEVIIVTGDKDIMQLVDDKKRIMVYAPVKGLSQGEMFNEKAVEEYVGVVPAQIIDYKALMGDASDNYPGVPGIGPKTAVALLKEYRGLENIYKAVRGKGEGRSIPPRILEKLAQGYDGAMLSQKLARIVCNVPVELDLERARLTDLSQNEKFIEKLKELGFRSLIARLHGQSKSKSRNESGDGRQMNLIGE